MEKTLPLLYNAICRNENHLQFDSPPLFLTDRVRKKGIMQSTLSVGLFPVYPSNRVTFDPDLLHVRITVMTTARLEFKVKVIDQGQLLLKTQSVRSCELE